MSVADNGNGGVKAKTGHHGISGISERVRGLDGELDIKSTNKGSQISITVPLAKL
jgi:signal transduction histidine kinase